MLIYRRRLAGVARGDLLPHAEDGVERDARLLEDVGDPRAAYLAEASAGGGEHVDLSTLEEQFDAALKLRPGFRPGLAGKGLALLSLGKPAAAAEYFSRERASAPQDPSACFRLGYALAAAGNAAKARYWYEQGIAAEPSYRLNYAGLGWLDLAEKAWERSRQEWDRATPTELDPEAVARLEDKLRNLKLRLAKETQKKTEAREK